MGRRRKHGIIDNLDPAVKSTVEEMILSAQFTYRDITQYITDTTGQSISQAAVCRYAKGFCEDAAAIHMAQENFRAIAEMCGKYPDLDTTEGIVQIMSSLVMTSVRNLSPEDLDGTDPSELVRAVSYKRSMDIKSKEITEAGFDAAKEKLFTGLASDDPELYRQLADYIESKKSELII